MRENVEETLELLSDVVQNPIFDDQDMEEAKEITRIMLQEMDMPQYMLHEQVVTTAFGNDTPIGQPFLCDINALPNISTDAQIRTTNRVTLETIFNIVIPVEPQRTDIIVKMEKQIPILPITIRQ